MQKNRITHLNFETVMDAFKFLGHLYPNRQTIEYRCDMQEKTR